MNIKDIKTKAEFWEVAEMWYKRTHKLREIWQDYGVSDKRKVKAFYLWNIMVKRMLKVNQVAIEINTPKAPKGFKPGGTIIKPLYNTPPV
jgi:threonyl-tRNA synthetase